MQLPYGDNLGVNRWHGSVVPNLITVRTRWGAHWGSENETNNMFDEGLKVYGSVLVIYF